MVNTKLNVISTKLNHINTISLFIKILIKVQINGYYNQTIYAHTKVFSHTIDMNAVPVKCRCGVHYTARDPHPLCRSCSVHNCSRSQPYSFCQPLSITEWDQEAKTSAYFSTRVSMDSSSPATEGLGSPQDSNIPLKSDSHEFSGNIETAVSSGEDIHLASHSGGDARITNLETGLSYLQTSLVNISSLLSSCFGPSLGTKIPQTSLPLGAPSCLESMPVSGILPMRSYMPVTPVVLPAGTPACLGSQIGPLEVAVTIGTTTTIVSTVSYHLTSLSSDTVTSFSVPGNRCSGLMPKMSTLTVPVKAPPPPVGQV